MICPQTIGFRLAGRDSSPESRAKRSGSKLRRLPRQLVAFLQALQAQIKGKLLIIWDGLPARRSRVVRDFVESLDGRIAMERLPGYAPELDPVEYLFGYAKQRELAILCLDTIAEVRTLRHPATQIDATSPRIDPRVLEAGRVADLMSCICIKLSKMTNYCSGRIALASSTSLTRSRVFPNCSEGHGRGRSHHRQGQQTGRQGRPDRDTRQETYTRSAKGQIWMAPDFDATPEDFKDYS